MKRNKILVIANVNNYNAKVLNNMLIDVDYTYYRFNFILIKIIMFLWVIYGIPFYSIWFKFKNRKVEEYELIILYECKCPDKIIKYIRRRNKKARIIYWLWDTADKSENKRFISIRKQIFNIIKQKDKYNCEIWSFDKNDCRKYNLFYNNQVSYKVDLPKQDIKYDFFFCGRDKNRLDIVKTLKRKFPKYKYKIQVIPDKGKNYDEEDKQYMLLRMMPYSEMMKYANQSKCIIDIVQKGQGGITWRPLEAMFYKKKLLTNFIDIQSYDFYNKNNIFILGKDDLSKLDQFLKSDYIDIPEKIIKNYLAEGWINNFINKNSRENEN